MQQKPLEGANLIWLKSCKNTNTSCSNRKAERSSDNSEVQKFVCVEIKSFMTLRKLRWEQGSSLTVSQGYRCDFVGRDMLILISAAL